MSFLRRILGRPDEPSGSGAPTSEPEPPDPEAAARARASSFFADDWNPEPEEVRAWAYADVPIPAPDFEFGIYDRFPAPFLAEFVEDEACPKRAFFLRCLYLKVWFALRGGVPIPEQRAEAESVVAALPPSPSSLVETWRADAQRLIRGETTWTPDWPDLATRRLEESARPE